MTGALPAPDTTPAADALLSRLDTEHLMLRGLSARHRLLAAAWLSSYRSGGRTRTHRPPRPSPEDPFPYFAVRVSFGSPGPVRDVVRQASKRSRRVHLFLVGPMGLAALLGHRWNRVRPTIVYEDVRYEHTYEAAFTVDA